MSLKDPLLLLSLELKVVLRQTCQGPCGQAFLIPFLIWLIILSSNSWHIQREQKSPQSSSIVHVMKYMISLHELYNLPLISRVVCKRMYAFKKYNDPPKLLRQHSGMRMCFDLMYFTTIQNSFYIWKKMLEYLLQNFLDLSHHLSLVLMYY